MPEHERGFVTIVSGLPRSGTSMMMGMLEAGGMPVLVDGIRKPDINNLNGYYEFEPVKSLRNDPSWLVMAQGRAVKIIYRLLHFLPRTFDYRVILMERDLSEVVDSQAAMLARQGSHMTAGDCARITELLVQDLSIFRDWIEMQSNFRAL